MLYMKLLRPLFQRSSPGVGHGETFPNGLTGKTLNFFTPLYFLSSCAVHVLAINTWERKYHDPQRLKLRTLFGGLFVMTGASYDQGRCWCRWEPDHWNISLANKSN